MIMYKTASQLYMNQLINKLNHWVCSISQN